MKKIFLVVVLSILFSQFFSRTILATPTPTVVEKSATSDAALETLRNKLAQKIKANKGITTYTIGFVKSLDSKNLQIETSEQKRRFFEYDEAITVLTNAAKSMPYFQNGELLSIKSEASSPNLALEIVSYPIYDFIIGEIVNIDSEKKVLTILTDISKQEIEVNLSKVAQLNSVQEKTMELKKTNISKIRMADKVSFPILSKTKKDKIFFPSRLTIIPSEVLEFSN